MSESDPRAFENSLRSLEHRLTEIEGRTRRAAGRRSAPAPRWTRIALAIGAVLIPLGAYAAVPYVFTNGTVADAVQVNADFADLDARLASFSPPIGSIVAWHGSLAGTPSLPANWVRCDGHTIVDPQSPYDGLATPDLNLRFLAGSGLASGGIGGSLTHTHTFSQTASDFVPDASHFSDGAIPVEASHLPPHMFVIWVMRIK